MRDPKEFRERFLRWKNGENYWEQRGISMNAQQSLDLQADLLTPEQLTAIEAALEYYTSGKDAVDDVPPERVSIFDPETTHILSFETGNLVPKRGYIVDNTGTMYAVDNRGLQYNSVLPEVEVVGDMSKFSQKLANLDLQNVLPADNVFVQNNLNPKAPNPELIYLNRYKGVDGMSGLENGIFEGIQWTPFVGDAIDLLLGASDLIDGNYLSAGLTGGLLFVPYGNKFRRLRNTIGDIKNVLKLDVPIRSKWQRFKNLDLFDKLRGIKFKTDIYHGSPVDFNIRDAKNYNPLKNDTGIHFGETTDPTYSRANPIEGGTVYKGRLKLKERPITVEDLGNWTPYSLYRQATIDENFKLALLERGITIDDLKLLDTGYMKGFADYMKDKGVTFRYRNEFETIKDVPNEFSYVTWDKDLPVWLLYHKYNKDQETIDKLKSLGVNDIQNVIKDFPVYQNPDDWVDFNRGKDKNEPTVVGRKYISDIKKQNPVYYDIMKRVGQENYQDWGFPSAYEATAHALKDTDYDYEGYYNKYPESDANSQTHWNDEYKGVLHPTFSDESIYHNVQNDTYNPYGLRGGIWIGDRFIALPYQNPFGYFNRGKDKGIHINPKNRGKFNALKKRTGKTTEQLTHSKNPLTRKRAIFAKMAKRGWKPLKKSK